LLSQTVVSLIVSADDVFSLTLCNLFI